MAGTEESVPILPSQIAYTPLEDILNDQWQSRTVARQEGKYRAPRTNQNIYMVTRPKIGFTDRP